MQQSSQPKAQLKKAAQSGFTYVGNSVTGRYYSDWSSGVHDKARLGHHLEWSSQIQVVLGCLGFINLILLAACGPGSYPDAFPSLIVISLIILSVVSATISLVALSAFAKPWRTYKEALAAYFLVLFSLGIFSPLLIGYFAFGFGCFAQVFGTAAFFHTFLNKRRRKMARRRLPKIDEPSPFPQIPVTIKVFSNNTLLGEDIGWVAFVDQFLHFQGKRTEFSLLGADVSVKRTRLEMLFGRHDTRYKYSESIGLQISWRVGKGRELLLIEPLEAVPGSKQEVLRDLGATLDAWHQTMKSPGLASTFPPPMATPEISARRRRRINAVHRWKAFIAVPTVFFIILSFFASFPHMGRFLFLTGVIGLLSFLVSCYLNRLTSGNLTELNQTH